MSTAFAHTISCMGTVVTFQVVGHERDREAVIARAEDWFHRVDAECSKFNAESDVMRVSRGAGRPVEVSTLVFECVQFALAIAAATDGAFDPTLGSAGASWRDVQLDEGARTVTVARPMVLDLGGVAKGLAIDLAAKELAPLENFAIYAGGDLFLAGTNAQGEPWSVGVRHPRSPDEIIEVMRLSNTAVCTSGDYERGAHIVDPRVGRPVAALASVTVIAPSAMVADALGTAAFVLGPADGAGFLRSQGVRGLLITTDLERIEA